jgi:hypothetical protein
MSALYIACLILLYFLSIIIIIIIIIILISYMRLIAFDQAG